MNRNDIKELREQVRKARRQWNSPANRRRQRKLYSNRRSMKRVIRLQESLVANCIGDWARASKVARGSIPNVPSLAHRLEWFFTWRLKLGCCAIKHWCDGVHSLKVTRTGNSSFHLGGTAYIGREGDPSAATSEWTLTGTITVGSRFDRLRSYNLTLTDGNSVCVARKAI